MKESSIESMDIDEILARAETSTDEHITAGDELLSSFKVASFSTSSNDNNDSAANGQQTTNANAVREEDAEFWQKIIPKADIEQHLHSTPLYLPPRNKKLVQPYLSDATLATASKQQGTKRKRDKKDVKLHLVKRKRSNKSCMSFIYLY